MDLSTSYLGLNLRNPLVASASPLSGTADGVRRLADAGVGAIVLPSLFEEQIRKQAAQNASWAEAGTESFAESLSYFPQAAADDPGPRQYLSLVERGAAVAGIPVIASLNGSTTGGWTRYATELQEAGAAAIELNIFHLPGGPVFPGREVEQRHVDILSTVKAAVRVPVAVKLSPYFSSAGEMALQLDRAGADGLVLFNRFVQPDVDPETLTVTARFGLSDRAEGRLPRVWIALLAGRIRASIAATTGVDQANDVASYLLAGADVVMTTSALLRYGVAHAGVLLDGLSQWLERKGFESPAAARGLLSVPAQARSDGSERAAYVTVMQEANAGHGPW